MAFPLIPLLGAAGLLGAQNFFANNADASNSFLDRALRIDRSGDRQREDQALFGGLDVSDPAAVQAATAQANDPASFQQRALAQSAEIRAQQEAERAQLAEQRAAAGELRAQEDQLRENLQFVRGREDVLREDYQANLQGYAQLQQNFTSMRSALESGTPQDVMAATINIMKVLDPTSVVRTEEGRMVATAGGTMEGLANELNKIMGEGWNEDTREAWFNAMRRQYAPAMQRAQRQIQQAEDNARRQQIDPAGVTTGLGIDRSFGAFNNPFMSAEGLDRQTARDRPPPPPGSEIIDQSLEGLSGARTSVLDLLFDEAPF